MIPTARTVPRARLQARNAGEAQRRRVTALVAGAALLAFATFFVRSAILHPAAFLHDNVINYDVWYCGAHVAAGHDDPYLVEPLRRCEHEVEPNIGWSGTWSVTPDPLPGYSFALMWPVLALPYHAGKMFWALLALAGLVIAAWSSARLLELPFWPVLAIFTPAIGMLNVIYGGPEPLAIAALCLAALALERERHSVAAGLASFAMIEPHVGLPAIAALAILVPRSRLALAVGLVVLAVLSLFVVGFGTNIEYVTKILPAQSYGESLISFRQYGLTHILYLLGAPARVAASLGSFSYLLMLALGIFAAARIHASSGRCAAVLLVPVATSLFGGLYLHSHQISAALPGALLLATFGAPYAWAAIAAVVLFAFPWTFDARLQEIGASFAVATSILSLVRTIGFPQRLILAAVVPIVFAAVWYLDLRLPHGKAHQTPQPALIRPSDPAPLAWSYLLRWTPGATVDDAATLLVKIPWWLALGGVTLAAAGAARMRRPA